MDDGATVVKTVNAKNLNEADVSRVGFCMFFGFLK